MTPSRSVPRVLPWLVWLVPFAAAFLAGDALAQAPKIPGVPVGATGSSLVKFTLEPGELLAPRGSSATVIALLRISPGWHVYWRNPGDSGVAPELRWTAPRGVTVGAPMWPRPQVFAGEHETTFGYESEVGLVVPIQIAPDRAAGEVELTCEASWMVCKEACLMGKGSATIRLRVSDGGNVSLPPEVVRHWLPRLPDFGTSSQGVRTRIVGSMLEISGPTRGFAAVSFLPGSDPGVEVAEAGPFLGAIESDGFRIEVPFSLPPNAVGGEDRRISGLVLWGESLVDPSLEVSEKIQPHAASSGSASASPPMGGSNSP